MLRLSLPWVRFWGDALGYQGAGGQGLPQQHSPIWDEQYAHHVLPILGKQTQVTLGAGHRALTD